MDLGGHHIILASGSPRRHELLGGIVPEFEIDTENNFKECVSPDVPFDEVPVLMAEGKSEGFHRPLKEGEILITADTMVILPPLGDLPGCILGKPSGREDAIGMLHALSGRSHKVITAVTIRSTERCVTFTDTSIVTFKSLSDKEIEFYIDKYSPFDKAGAYGVQEWIGYVGIEHIDGSFYNVMGLPTAKVYEHLKEFL